MLRRTDEPVAKQLSTATSPLCFGLFRCRVVVDFHVVQSALQNSIVYVAKSPFLLTPCESQDVCTVKAWLRGNSGGRRHFEYA